MSTDGSRSRVVGRTLKAVPVLGLAAAWREAHRQAEEAREDGRRAREKGERTERALRAELQEERQMIARLQQSRRAEREWNRELRSQLQRLHERDAVVGQPGDVRALVLEAACRLLDAEKGLMVASTDADGDGRLDLPVARGFEHDPTDSAIAQRFAREVLERDETIRESAPADDPGMASALTDADREIENLVAVPVYLRDRFHGVVVCANREGGFRDVDDDLLLSVGDHAGAALHTGHLRLDLADAHQGAVQMLLEALAAQDVERHRQSAQLAALAGSFADALEFDQTEHETLVLGALLRDLGFLTIPEHVLHHPGSLGPDERAVVELHPRIGFAVLRRLPVLRDVAYAVLYHHERHDGSGYPYGLSRDDIPVSARAVALLDAFSAMTNDRPYRSAVSMEEACRRLVDAAGTQFDPELTALFTEHVRTRGPLPDDAVDQVLQRVTLLPSGADSALFGALTAPDVDPLTLIGGHRAFYVHLETVLGSVAAEDVVLLALVQLEELARLNDEAGHLAGDRLVQASARAAERAAARAAGTAFRISGRRLAIVVKVAPDAAADVLRDIDLEFATGPSVRTSAATGRAGMAPDELVAAARSALRPAAR